MTVLTVVMPLAGLGSRFKSVGQITSKPLIKVNGRAMFLEALESLNFLSPDQINLVFVCRRDDPYLDSLVAEIKRNLPSSSVFMLEKVTRGAAESCYLAAQFIDADAPLLIMDCDIRFSSTGLEDLLLNEFDGDCDGALITFSSSDPRYSYVSTRSNLAVRTAEKIVISNQAIIGAYFFSRGEFFLDSCRDLLSENISAVRPEYYVSEVFNVLIKNQKRIIVLPGEFSSFGTPEELKTYQEFHD
jgi:dTDP-glucose pyrophosphorylase